MSFFQFFPNPSRIPPHIENGDNSSSVVHNLVVDREWESAGEHPVVTQPHAMDAGLEKKRIDVRNNTIKEVSADPLMLSIIKGDTVPEVVRGFLEDDDVLYTLHEKRLRSSSRVRNFASPDAIFSLRALRTVRCHAGDSGSSSPRRRESQSNSMAASRSCTDICLISAIPMSLR
jgi:hypothetical protein